MSESSITWSTIATNAKAALDLISEVNQDIGTYNNGSGNVVQVVSDLESISDNPEYTDIKQAPTVQTLLTNVNTAVQNANLSVTLPATQSISAVSGTSNLTFLDANGNPLTASSTALSTISTQPLTITLDSDFDTSNLKDLTFLTGGDASQLSDLINQAYDQMDAPWSIDTTDSLSTTTMIRLNSSGIDATMTIDGNSQITLSFSGLPTAFGVTSSGAVYSTQIQDGNGNWQTLTFTSPDANASMENCTANTIITTGIHMYVDSEFETNNLAQMTFLSSSAASTLATVIAGTAEHSSNEDNVSLGDGITVSSDFTGNERQMYIVLSGPASAFGFSTPLTPLINFLNSNPV